MLILGVLYLGCSPHSPQSVLRDFGRTRDAGLPAGPSSVHTCALGYYSEDLVSSWWCDQKGSVYRKQGLVGGVRSLEPVLGGGTVGP